MTDRMVYACRECHTATVDGVKPPERDCAVCGEQMWRWEGQIR